MPMKGQLLDSRGWGTRSGKGTVAAVEPAHGDPAIRYGVCFLDRLDARTWAPRAVWLDYLPERWVRLDAQGLSGYKRRVWIREDGGTGVIYREQVPTKFQPTAYDKGRKVKTEEEDWSA